MEKIIKLLKPPLELLTIYRWKKFYWDIKFLLNPNSYLVKSLQNRCKIKTFNQTMSSVGIVAGIILAYVLTPLFLIISVLFVILYNLSKFNTREFLWRTGIPDMLDEFCKLGWEDACRQRGISLKDNPFEPFWNENIEDDDSVK